MTCESRAGAGELVLHIDVDAFFASVEQLLIPGLRGRPVIVGSGVIASCSYEARKFGLRAGMELNEAKRRCAGVVILEGDYQIYRCFAEHLWDVCRGYTCGLETYLDEAYGDATGMAGVHGSPLEMGRKLQKQVLAEVGLPVSIGLGANRMLAKIASSGAKPAGVACIAPGQEEEFLGPLAIEKLPGVGHKTARQLHDLNIKTVGQLRVLSREALGAMLGVRGEILFDRCRGVDVQAAVGAKGAIPKTISRETTFHEPTCDGAAIRGMLFYLLERAMRMARQKRLAVGRVDVSIRYNDWKQVEAGLALPQPAVADDEVFEVVKGLLEGLYKRRVALRHVGLTLSRFSPLGSAARLFDPPQKIQRRELSEALDAIRDRYGHGAVISGQSISLLGELEQNDYGFVLRTPSLTK